MLEALKSKGRMVFDRGSERLRVRFSAADLDQARRYAPLAVPLTAILVIAGCSWFNDNSVPAPDENPAQAGTQEGKVTMPAPGEGEAMENGSAASDENKTAETGTATATGETQTAQAGEATFPDINSVPNEAPKPSIVDLNQAPAGLASDSANAQHTDETLTMPNESAARPEKPGGEEGQVASVEPTAPETPPAQPEVTPEAVTPTPEPAPAAQATPLRAPEPAPAPEPAQVASAGTPQPGSSPFEPNGPLYLAPGSLARNPQEAAVATAPVATAPTPITSEPMPGSEPTAPPSAPTALAAVPAPMPAPAPSGEAVSVDYSVLDGLGSGAAQSSAPVMSPMVPATNAQIAGVGQAVGYVYFNNNSSQLSSADRQVLQQVVMLQRIQGGVLRIIGHASQRTGNLDALAQDQVNRRVSLARANAVAQALVGMGVQPLLVQVAAAGDNQTLYSESTPAGEAGNRRAEVYLSQN